MDDGVNTLGADARHTSPSAPLSRQGSSSINGFSSILSSCAEGRLPDFATVEPACFHDLLLDRVIDAIDAGCADFDLKPFFHTPQHDAQTVLFRQEVMQDLESSSTADPVRRFCQDMRAMRDQLAQAHKLYYPYQKAWWFLEAAKTYRSAATQLTAALSVLNLRSRGMRSLAAYLAKYVAASGFQALAADIEQVSSALASIRYCVRIHGNSVTVQRFDGEADYGAEVEATFAKFRRRAVRDYRGKFPTYHMMGHVEAQILDRVALLYPDKFAALDRFCEVHAEFGDERILRFDHEVQFYLAYLSYVERFRQAGLVLCYPAVSRESKSIACEDGFDIALAHKLVAEDRPIVTNGFRLADAERIFVVTGPNQGGKTTFARMFGQLHYLACLGCPVPAKAASLFLFDNLFTHFERQENVTSLRGKLQDDLLRIRAILTAATPNSVIILNEIFSSTTLKDAVFLSIKIMESISQTDALGVCVTFLSELASLNQKTASMVGVVDPTDPAIRTYKLERRPADGVAYATALARKYRVTYPELKERIQP